MSIDATSESAIFEQIMLPDEPGLSGDVARTVLTLKFSPEDRVRMQVLADKAKQGNLTPDEQQAIDNFERVGHYLAILQSKWRESRRAPDADSAG